jgi:hypothetical protein
MLAALFLATAVLGTAQTYTFDIIGTYTGVVSNPNNASTTPFTGANFELRFSTDNVFTPTLSGPIFGTLKNITYTNNGVAKNPVSGSMNLCAAACNGTETGGLDVSLSSVYGTGDGLEFQLSGPPLFTGPVLTPTVSTGIFQLLPGGGGSIGARYVGPSQTCCASEGVLNVTVIITAQAPNGPVISFLTPPGATAGGSGFPLTVNGSGFQVGAVVYWNGALLPTNFTDVNHLIATVPFNLIVSSGTATVTVANPGPILSNAVSFVVSPFFNGSLTFVTQSPLPAGHIGTPYTLILQAAGGTGPYSFSLLSGQLPAGLSLSGSGVISGTPSVNATSTFTVGIADSNFASANQSFSLTISPQTFDFTTALRVAQIAEGLNWKTLFIITNLDQTPTNYTFRFWDDNGNSLPLPLLNSSPGFLTGTLAGGGTTFAETPGNSASLLQGWGEVASTGRLGVTTIFRSTIPGRPVSQGTVTGVSSGSRVILQFDNTQGFSTGVAIANTNPSQSLNISLVFQLENGSQINGSLFLTAHAHKAFDLATMFPSVAGVRGSILFTASSPDITVVGLSFTPGALAFTSLSSFQ